MNNAFLTLPSPFPVDHRLVHIWPVLSWPKQGEDSAGIGPELRRFVNLILDKHTDSRGLIHSVGYNHSLLLARFCRSPRLIFHTGHPDDFERALDALYATPRGVLVSPRATEGVDLKGDRSEFQIFIKLPFLYWGEQRVQDRARANKTWYALMTAVNLIQGSGRSVRNMNDIAPTYILDARAHWWFKDNAKLFPQYFHDALTAANSRSEKEPAT